MIRSYCPIHGENSPHSYSQCMLCQQEREEKRLNEEFEEWSKDKTIDEMIFDLFCRIKKLGNKSRFSDIIG
ncbi:MAG: hypothetical protein K9H48_07755 [Melioribacteraceae bacterium]|nr:hypothetical protein [Melioribacteraceae bacterium]